MRVRLGLCSANEIIEDRQGKLVEILTVHTTPRTEEIKTWRVLYKSKWYKYRDTYYDVDLDSVIHRFVEE